MKHGTLTDNRKPEGQRDYTLKHGSLTDNRKASRIERLYLETRFTDRQTTGKPVGQRDYTLKHGPLTVALNKEGPPLQLRPGVQPVLQSQAAGVSHPARDAVGRLVAVVGPVVT